MTTMDNRDDRQYEGLIEYVYDSIHPTTSLEPLAVGNPWATERPDKTLFHLLEKTLSLHVWIE